MSDLEGDARLAVGYVSIPMPRHIDGWCGDDPPRHQSGVINSHVSHYPKVLNKKTASTSYSKAIVLLSFNSLMFN
jgi:hypothetical protein